MYYDNIQSTCNICTLKYMYFEVHMHHMYMYIYNISVLKKPYLLSKVDSIHNIVPNIADM